MRTAVRVRWRKAIAVSMVLHVVLLTGVGWMAGRQFAAHDPPEKYVELELINEPYSAAPAAADNVAKSARVYSAAAATPVPAVRERTAPAAVLVDRAVAVSAGGPVVAGPPASLPRAGNGTPASGQAPGAQKRTADMAWIMEVFARRLEEKKDYPYIARKRGQAGTVLVRVRLQPSGELEDAVVVASSGVGRLDEAAIKLIRDACPFEHGTGRFLAVTVPITYVLKE